MDKLPPYALESEQCVIGCCLTDPLESIHQSQLVITGRDFFYDFRCQLVWETICGMELAQVNFISVHQRLKDGTPEQQKVTLDFLQECQNLVTSAANLPTWLEEVEAKKIARDIIRSCTQTIAAVYGGGDVMRILESHET